MKKWTYRVFAMAALALLATALAPLIDSEQHRLWMLLTYPPRLLPVSYTHLRAHET